MLTEKPAHGDSWGVFVPVAVTVAFVCDTPDAGTVVIHTALLHTNFTAIFAGTNFSTRTVSSTEWFLASVMNSERSNRRKSFQSESRSVTTFSAQEESSLIPTPAVILALRKKVVSFQHLQLF